MAIPFLGILTTLASPVTKYLEKRGEIKIAEHTRNLAIINNQARLAADRETNNAQWEMASLQDKDRWLRRFSFVMFTSPVFLAVASPTYWAEVVVQLNTIPQWMLTIWFYMIAGIWGISSLKEAVPAMIAGMRKNR